MHTRWLTERRETQIVAFLLLFFLAHMALGQCEQSFQVEVHYNCSVATADHPTPIEWNESRDGSSCVTLGDDWKSFDRKSAAIVDSDKLQVVNYVSGEDVSGQLLRVANQGDFIVGLELTRGPRNGPPAAKGSGLAIYDTKAIAFVSTAVVGGAFVPALDTKLIKKSEVAITSMDGSPQDIAVSTPDGKVNLYCTFSVK